jgi:hypothetical protein
LKNGELLRTIDFETTCCYTWINTNISSIIDWDVLLMDPNLCVEKFEEYTHNNGRMFLVDINDGEYFLPLILENNY